MQPIKRMARQDAERIIRRFLRHEGFRTFEMVKDGDRNWAFWPTSQSRTTSYLRVDGSIEWYGQGRR